MKNRLITMLALGTAITLQACSPLSYSNSPGAETKVIYKSIDESSLSSRFPNESFEHLDREIANVLDGKTKQFTLNEDDLAKMIEQLKLTEHEVVGYHKSPNFFYEGFNGKNENGCDVTIRILNSSFRREGIRDKMKRSFSYCSTCTDGEFYSLEGTFSDSLDVLLQGKDFGGPPEYFVFSHIKNKSEERTKEVSITSFPIR